ncbi:DNA-processing protein DprA [Bacillus benzoevorans]|uniref:DNA processing protein n=1 Tax=Bacillus benzoevorans TaxID=1456 RepID=A0A7X0LTW0_9BACI|nr:DNA-processing protein DprA [Bacillus benzoevorans]MBB6443830.1 DNA processing protein [Bacillus benzoevorans]
MNDFKKRLVLLHHCPGASWKHILSILKKDPQLISLYDEQRLKDFIPSPAANAILKDFHSPSLIHTLKLYEQNGISCVTIFDQEYPVMLRETSMPPWVLYAKGDLGLLKTKHLLAVVGSRQATAYGKKAIEQLFPRLIGSQIVIVSGLAAGIDAYAHQTAIQYGGKTIGVIAGGFNHLYPKENVLLANVMMKDHLVLTEYPFFMRPQKWHFPLRNRIIAGLCQGTLVVEAKQKSGSLITANYAVQEGRDVFAVPGHILGPHSTGTNELIQQGAKLIISAQDILDEII